MTRWLTWQQPFAFLLTDLQPWPPSQTSFFIPFHFVVCLALQCPLLRLPYSSDKLLAHMRFQKIIRMNFTTTPPGGPTARPRSQNRYVQDTFLFHITGNKREFVSGWGGGLRGPKVTIRECFLLSLRFCSTFEVLNRHC